ncbi:hypothetical protein Slin14017_G035900 [Septoria linicola]|nr:hypothetical protein Slin14017_G035900 [Septoria linicola]
MAKKGKRKENPSTPAPIHSDTDHVEAVITRDHNEPVYSSSYMSDQHSFEY